MDKRTRTLDDPAVMECPDLNLIKREALVRSQTHRFDTSAELEPVISNEVGRLAVDDQCRIFRDVLLTDRGCLPTKLVAPIVKSNSRGVMGSHNDQALLGLAGISHAGGCSGRGKRVTRSKERKDREHQRGSDLQSGIPHRL